jgi:hypothetical protein
VLSDGVREWLTNGLILIWLVVTIGIFAGLVNPKLVRMKSRAAAFFTFFVASLSFLLVIGMIAPKEPDTQPLAGDTTAVSPDGEPVLPGSAADAADGVEPAPEEPEATHVLQGTEAIAVSVSSTRWNREALVAELPPGTEVRLMERQTTAAGVERCQVATTFPPAVTGWVMCASLRE